MKDCVLCNSYIHDVLSRPFPRNHGFHKFYNYKVLERIMPEIVFEFERLIATHHFETTEPPSRTRIMYLNIRLIEEGFVRGTIRPLFPCTTWIHYQVEQLSHIKLIHRDHVGGFKELPPNPLPLDILRKYEKAGFVKPDLDVTSEIE
jgi:hypothetical protein